MEEKIHRRVETIKSRIDNKLLMADAASLAANEVCIEHKLGKLAAQTMAATIRAAVLKYDSEEKTEKIEDLRIIAYDTGEELLSDFGYDDEQVKDMVDEYRSALDQYLHELEKERT